MEMSKGPTLEAVKDAMQEAADMDLPAGAEWQMIHDLLGVQVGDINDLIRKASEAPQ